MYKLLKYSFRTVSAEDVKQAVDKWCAKQKSVTMTLLEKLHSNKKCKDQLKEVDLSAVLSRKCSIALYLHSYSHDYIACY